MNKPLNKKLTKKLTKTRTKVIESDTQLRMFVHHKIYCCGCYRTFEDAVYEHELVKHICGTVGLVENRIGFDSYYICRNIGFGGAHHKLCKCGDDLYHNEYSPESEVKIFYYAPGLRHG